MKQPWFSDNQIANALRRVESELPVPGGRRQFELSAPRVRQSRKKGDQLGSSETRSFSALRTRA